MMNDTINDHHGPGKMRFLVLSDIHYPVTDKMELSNIIRQAKADKVVFLGDNVQDDRYVGEFLEVVRSAGCRDCTFLLGDEDAGIPGKRYHEVTVGNRRLIFTHGNQFNISSEKSTKRFARALKKIHRLLPVLAFVVSAKVRTRTDSGYLILGHSHALAFFPRLRVGCAGCLTTKKNVYSERGYIIVDVGEDQVSLSTIALDGPRHTFVL